MSCRTPNFSIIIEKLLTITKKNNNKMRMSCNSVLNTGTLSVKNMQLNAYVPHTTARHDLLRIRGA